MDFTPILEAVISLAALLITSFVIPFIKRKIGAEKQAEFLAWVEIAVAAAEQMYDSCMPSAKKSYVKKFLTSKGYAVDDAKLDAAIEAAVLSLHNDLYVSWNSPEEKDIEARMNKSCEAFWSEEGI